MNPNLTWDEYEIEGEIVDFKVTQYRGSDSTALNPIEENIPFTVNVFTDNDPLAPEELNYYRVAGVLSELCYPAGNLKYFPPDLRLSMSNLEDN